MIHSVNLNLLRSLKVLLEECHISRAAQKLNLTQSAVSRQLSQFRSLFDGPLLVRRQSFDPNSQGITITGEVSSLVSGAG